MTFDGQNTRAHSLDLAKRRPRLAALHPLGRQPSQLQTRSLEALTQTLDGGKDGQSSSRHHREQREEKR